MSNSKSKSIWIYIIGGLFVLFALASINGKTSESRPDNQVKSVATNQAAPIKPEVKEEIFTVKRIIDGDTVELENGEKVRYIGVNTPESVDPRKSVECFAKEASKKNKELVEGKKVRLEKDISERDKYNRLLRYVYLENRTFINLTLVEQGFAQSANYPPDVKYQEEFRKAETKARDQKIGLWADNACAETTSQIEPEIKPQADVEDGLPPTTESTPQEDIIPPETEPKTIPENLPESNATVPETSSGGVVKKSTSDICHAPGTTYYDRTKNFILYDTLQGCLDSGGRLPER